MAPIDEYMDNVLADYVRVAAMDTLKERECLVVDLRYGLSDGEGRPLQQIGERIGVSRERVRQILEKCQRRLKAAGKRQARQGQSTRPSGSLQLYLAGVVRPGEVGDGERLWLLVRDVTPNLAALAAYLVADDKDMERRYLRECDALDARRKALLREEARTERALGSFKRLLTEGIAWPGGGRVLTSMPTTGRMRDVSEDSEGRCGYFYSDKGGSGVQYESNLEYAFLQKLERAPWVVAYQEQPFKIPYEDQGRARVYYPDIFFIGGDGRGVVVEIKPRVQFALHTNLMKWRALRRFCEAHGYGLLITDGRVPIQTLTRRTARADFGEAIEVALRREPLDWRGYTLIRDRYSASYDDFLTVILRHQLVWTLHPFTLRREMTTEPRERLEVS